MNIGNVIAVVMGHTLGLVVWTLHKNMDLGLRCGCAAVVSKSYSYRYGTRQDNNNCYLFIVQ